MTRSFTWAARTETPSISPWGLLTASGFLVGCATAVGFLGRFWWFFDLFSHFRVQYSVILATVVMALAVGRKWKAAAAFTALILLNLLIIAPLYGGEAREIRTKAGQYRAMLVNVQTENERYAEAVLAIQAYDPDLVVLLEINWDWMNALKDLRKSYPHWVTRSREDNFGIALLSRLPINEWEIVSLSTHDVPSILARIAVDAHAFTVLATHPVPPVSPQEWEARNEHLAAIPGLLKERAGPALVLGDLNTTPWSHSFHRLITLGRLQDCSKGRGVQPTWPTNQPWLLIPIDHCLHSEGITVLDKQVGWTVGSDHYPVIVDFSVSSS